MGYLNRYNKKVSNNRPGSASNPFIEMALNKIKIQKFVSGETNQKKLDAVLVFRDREGPDSGILYTYEKDGLKVSDSIVKKGSKIETDAYYLITEEVKRVDGSANIRVFNVLETNVLVSKDSSGEVLPGYLLSNLRSNIKNSTKEGIVLELKKATLIVPTSYRITLNNKLNIRNLITKEESYASWLVEGIDDVSTPGINYIYLNQALKEDFVDEEEFGETSIIALSSLTLETNMGYIKTTPSSTILERSANKVIVVVPDIEGDYSVETKNSSGDIIETKYTVRG